MKCALLAWSRWCSRHAAGGASASRRPVTSRPDRVHARRPRFRFRLCGCDAAAADGPFRSASAWQGLRPGARIGRSDGRRLLLPDGASGSRLRRPLDRSATTVFHVPRSRPAPNGARHRLVARWTRVVATRRRQETVLHRSLRPARRPGRFARLTATMACERHPAWSPDGTTHRVRTPARRDAPRSSSRTERATMRALLAADRSPRGPPTLDEFAFLATARDQLPPLTISTSSIRVRVPR